MDRAHTLLQWSAEYSSDQPDVAALLARAAATLLSRTQRKVVDLPATKVEETPVRRLPTIPANFNLTSKRGRLLKTLQEMPGLTMQELATLLSVDRSAVGMMLRPMEEAGLVKREAGVPNGTTKPPLRWFAGNKAREGVA